MRAVLVTCTCLFMVNLAVSQKSNSCHIRVEKSKCRSFPDLSLAIDKTERICLLKKIMKFYENMASKAYTKRVPKEKISALEDHLKQYTSTCLKCRKCKEIAKEKPLKCDNYSTRMVLNQTQIRNCQEWLLKKAKRKSKKNPKQVQEKIIYELYILIQFVAEAN